MNILRANAITIGVDPGVTNIITWVPMNGAGQQVGDAIALSRRWYNNVTGQTKRAHGQQRALAARKKSDPAFNSAVNMVALYSLTLCGVSAGEQMMASRQRRIAYPTLFAFYGNEANSRTRFANYSGGQRAVMEMATLITGTHPKLQPRQYDAAAAPKERNLLGRDRKFYISHDPNRVKAFVFGDADVAKPNSPISNASSSPVKKLMVELRRRVGSRFYEQDEFRTSCLLSGPCNMRMFNMPTIQPPDHLHQQQFVRRTHGAEGYSVL